MSLISNLQELDKDDLLYLARLSEHAERYDEMIEYVNAFIARETNELSIDERNIVSVAYKNVVGTRRTSWRVLTSIQQKEERRGNADRKDWARNYRVEIENELRDKCHEVIRKVDNELLPKVPADQAEGRVFYMKMKGDYYRYLCEFIQGEERAQAIVDGENAYRQAMELSEAQLSTVQPTRLGLALNFSVFFYEIKELKQEACDLAQKAFDDAIPELDNIASDSYKDATQILQLLRDNLTLWKSELGDDSQEAQTKKFNLQNYIYSCPCYSRIDRKKRKSRVSTKLLAIYRTLSLFKFYPLKFRSLQLINLSSIIPNHAQLILQHGRNKEPKNNCTNQYKNSSHLICIPQYHNNTSYVAKNHPSKYNLQRNHNINKQVGQKLNKKSLIKHPHTVINPGTMMIHIQHTGLTNSTMVHSIRFDNPTFTTSQKIIVFFSTILIHQFQILHLIIKRGPWISQHTSHMRDKRNYSKQRMCYRHSYSYIRIKLGYL